MRSVGERDTAPEVRLRKAFWSEGLRYRTQLRVHGVRVDVAFPGPMVAVFVDGCFWHGCPRHYSIPATNEAFWAKKLEINRARDVRNNRTLQANGWRVIRLWQCEVESRLAKAVSRVQIAVRKKPRIKGKTPAPLKLALGKKFRVGSESRHG
jgi:DNA mismatch endonuclease (patch repair protein)